MNNERKEEELLQFRFSYSENLKIFKIPLKEIKYRTDIIDIVLKESKNYFSNEIFEETFNNDFIFSSCVEISSYDIFGNCVKYNLLDLYFDKKLFSYEQAKLFCRKNVNCIFLYVVW